MKFCIFGAGGTGGVLAAYLAMAGHDVTLIARGAHLAAIQEQGLTLHTNHRGTEVIRNLKTCTAAAYEDVPDVLFVCVKYYDLEDAIAFAREIRLPLSKSAPRAIWAFMILSVSSSRVGMKRRAMVIIMASSWAGK